jgi:Tfp pilus assembly protein PilF
VLTTLGSRSDRERRSNTGLLLGMIVVGLLAAGIWWMLPRAGSPKTPAAQPATAGQAALPKPPTPRGIGAKEPARPAPVTKAVESQPTVARPVEPRPPETGLAERLPTNAAREGTALTRSSVPAKAVPVPPEGPPVTEPKSASGGTARPNTDDFRLALYYQRAGNFELALVHYTAVLQRDELNVDAHNNLGNLYLSKGLFDDAAREFRRVIAVEPVHVTAHVNLSAVLYQLKRYDEAAAEARTAIRLDARNGDAFVNLALSQTASGQPGEARASLTHALEIDRHNAAAHYNLALQYEKAGEVALALDHYRAFLQYAAPEQAGYAADVRSRVRALESKREPGTSNREP